MLYENFTVIIWSSVSSSTSSASLMLTSMLNSFAFALCITTAPLETWLESWWTAFTLACQFLFIIVNLPSVHTAAFFLLPILPIKHFTSSCAAFVHGNFSGGTLLPWLINLSWVIVMIIVFLGAVHMPLEWAFSLALDFAAWKRGWFRLCGLLFFLVGLASISLPVASACLPLVHLVVFDFGCGSDMSPIAVSWEWDGVGSTHVSCSGFMGGIAASLWWHCE